MLRRLLTLTLIVGICLFALYRIRQSLRSPAEKLQLQVSSMVAGFNAGRLEPVLSGIHPSFIDVQSGTDKSRIRDGLRVLVTQYRHNKQFALEYQWILPFEPEIDEELGVARSLAEFQIVDHRAKPPTVLWESPIELEFVFEGGAWRLTKTKNVAKHPF